MAENYFAFIRHGDYQQKKDVPSALQPYALTEKGITQSIEAARTVEEFALTLNAEIHASIDSSPLLRAWQTAKLMAENIRSNSIKVETFPELVERSVGNAANLSILEIEQILTDDPRCDSPPKDWKSNSEYCLPFLGAESLLQGGERVKRHIQKRLQTYSTHTSPNATLKIFVGHGAAMRHAAYLMGILSFEDISRLSMYHAKPIFFKMEKSGFKHISGDWKQRSTTPNAEENHFTD